MFCTNCGTERIEGSNFCSRCGNQFNKVKLENNSISSFSRYKIVIELLIVLVLGIIFFRETIVEISELMEDLSNFDMMYVWIDLAYLLCELAGLGACIMTFIRRLNNDDNWKIPTIVLLIIAIICIILSTLFAIFSFLFGGYGIGYVFKYIIEYTILYIFIYAILIVLNIYR